MWCICSRCGSCCGDVAHADVTVSLPNIIHSIIHILSKSRTSISTSIRSVSTKDINIFITINITEQRLKTATHGPCTSARMLASGDGEME